MNCKSEPPPDISKERLMLKCLFNGQLKLDTEVFVGYFRLNYNVCIYRPETDDQYKWTFLV